MNQHSSRKGKYSSPLIGAALVAASLFQFSFPVFAAGTDPGQTLRNTATGTYKDDADNDYTIESNTVDVTVAKVAGITNINSSFTFDNTTDPTNTELSTGDRAYFEFTITNVGNDTANIFIPDLAEIAPNTSGISTDTGGATDADNFIIQVSGPLAPGASPTFTDIAPGGTDTIPAGEVRPATGIVENVAVSGTVVVRITSTVTATAANAPIEVRLGDTGSNLDPNAPVADTQNRPDDGVDDPDAAGPIPTDAAQANNEVRTLDPTTSAFPTAPALVGGQKEASALIQQFLGSNPLAMARIEKTRGTIEDNGADPVGGPTNDTPGNLGDDIIPYSLDLEVLATTPNSFYTPADMQGRDYTPAPTNPNSATFTDLTGAAALFADVSNLILISDAIPADTKLAADLGDPVNGWTPVYTTDTTGTPDEMTWTAQKPGDQATRDNVTRVGWVYDAGTTGAITLGTVVDGATNGFTFNVVTSGLTTTGGTIANIAQVFGGSVGGEEIFDESGDQSPSNFNQDGNIGPTETDPLSTGIADPATHGIDTENNNNFNGIDPASPGGEDNVVTINDATLNGLLIGPQGQATATGDVFEIDPADNNHDFQNLGVDNFPANAKHNAGTTFDPTPVTFSNSVTNPTATTIEDVLLQPINPDFDNTLFDNNGVTGAVIPEDTKVRIIRGAQESVYDYVGGIFVFNGPESGSPVIVPPLNPGDTLDYTVVVDLPADTGLSTDDAINGGFPIPIVAFRDADSSGSPTTGDDLNLTVNQVYTGFMKLAKQVRVLDPNGDVRPNMDFNDPDNDGATPPVNLKTPAPGDILEYRVIYRNISETQVGSNTNVILNGQNVLIDENGTAGTTNWGLDNNADGDIDTINVQGTAADSSGTSTITFYSGVGANIDAMSSSGTVDSGVDVTGYRSTVPTVAPAGKEDLTGVTDPWDETVDAGDFTFSFQRKVDEFDGVAPTFSEE